MYLAIHGLAGETWAELAAILAIIAALWAGGAKVASWSKKLVRDIVEQVTEPIVSSVDRLSDMTKLAQHRTDERLAEHDQELGKHNRELGELYGTVGLTRRGRSNDRGED